MKYFLHFLDASVRSSEIFGRVVVGKGKLMRGEGSQLNRISTKLTKLVLIDFQNKINLLKT